MSQNQLITNFHHFFIKICNLKYIGQVYKLKTEYLSQFKNNNHINVQIHNRMFDIVLDIFCVSYSDCVYSYNTDFLYKIMTSHLFSKYWSVCLRMKYLKLLCTCDNECYEYKQFVDKILKHYNSIGYIDTNSEIMMKHVCDNIIDHDYFKVLSFNTVTSLFNTYKIDNYQKIFLFLDRNKYHEVDIKYLQYSVLKSLSLDIEDKDFVDTLKINKVQLSELHGHILSALDFNKFMKDSKLIKFVHHDSIHYGMNYSIYKNGENIVNIESFKPWGECYSGGIYFTLDSEDSKEYFCEVDDIKMNAIIPELNNFVYIEYDKDKAVPPKFKTHIINLKK